MTMIHRHIEGVKVSAHFSKDGKYRYKLVVELQGAVQNGGTVCAVMQNPSYANQDRADKSVQFLEKVVFQKGLQEFRGVKRLIVVNQFAYIETNNFEGRSDQIGAMNNSTIQAVLEDADIILLAWGSGNRFKERQDFVMHLIKQLRGKKLYRTKMHPSRGRYEGFIQPIIALN